MWGMQKRFHASCSNLSDNELLRIESGDGAWYCTNCKADCGLCSGQVQLKSVRRDSCDMWIDIMNDHGLEQTQYEIVNTQTEHGFARNVNSHHFSDSFFGEQVNLETENSMFPLAFVAGWLQGHWWGFISRNYVVWPTFLLMNVFIALKGSHFWFLFVSLTKEKKDRSSPCGTNKSSFIS